MNRRDFITLLGGAAAWPVAARAQQPERMRQVGVFIGTTDSLTASGASDLSEDPRVLAFREGLGKLGWMEGRNVRFEYARTDSDPNRIRAAAAELVARAPHAIIGSAIATGPLQQATRVIPIVSVGVPDPIAQGYVASLARPGGNITGFSYFELSVGAKRLQLLKEIAPSVMRVAFLYDPVNPAWQGLLAEVEAAARAIGVEVHAIGVRTPGDIGRAFDALSLAPNAGLLMAGGPATNNNSDLISALAARHGIAAVYSFRFFVTGGGLASYGVDIVDPYRRAASYIDRILRGDKPADLPFQQATKLELAINLKTAKALGLTISPNLLATADEVIE
jgi:putative ABC transport system substrate-binding protein